MRTHCMLVSAGLLAAAACASGGTSPLEDVHAPPRIERSGNTFYINLPDDGQPTSDAIAAPAEDAFHALAVVYEELAIPIETIQSASRTLGNRRFRVRGKVGGMRMSTLVRCGTGPAGDHADSHTITFDILTRVVPTGADAVVVQTALSATARTMEGASGHELRCGSTGTLEREIVERLRRLVEA